MFTGGKDAYRTKQKNMFIYSLGDFMTSVKKLGSRQHLKMVQDKKSGFFRIGNSHILSSYIQLYPIVG